MKPTFITIVLGSLLAGAQAQEVAVIPLGTTSNPGTFYSARGPIDRTVLSPDGKTVAFLYFSHLRVVNLETKEMRELRSDFAGSQGFTFSADSAALHASLGAHHYRIPLSGGATTEGAGEPQPGNRAKVITRANGNNEVAVCLIDRDGKERVIALGQRWPQAWWEWSADSSVLRLMIWRDHRHRLLEVDPLTGNSKELASGEGYIDSLLWRRGDGMYFIRPKPHGRDIAGEIWRYPAAGGEPRQLTSGTAGFSKIVDRNP